MDRYRNDPDLRAELLREVTEREAARGVPKQEVKKVVKVADQCLRHKWRV